MSIDDFGSSAALTKTPRRGRRKLTGWRAFLRDVVVILVAAVVISALIKAFVVRSFYIPSASMQNTLMVNDRIIVNELEPGILPIKRGDVIVFKDPGGWLSAEGTAGSTSTSPIDWALSVVGITAPDSNDHLVKRVIGLPGDHVTCCNATGEIEINGVPIKEPYTNLNGNVAASGTSFDVWVPANSLWVMGDNRYDSADSRYHQSLPTKGFVAYSDVVGRAILITWPVSRWTVLDDYPQVFAEVAKKSGGG